ncbi:MAG: hypothetical protein ABIP61_14335, partial [Burkholderiaceae bacterium]
MGDRPQATQCNGSHCHRKGHWLRPAPRARFTLEIPERGGLPARRFDNKPVINHPFRPACGSALLGADAAAADSPIAAPNVRRPDNASRVTRARA